MSILEEPTNEYSMRHAANLLSNMVRAIQGTVSPSDMEVIDFAYQQLHRGANTLANGGPRVIEVCYNNDGIKWPNQNTICYGQAITGWPIRLATITEAPRDDAARDWIRDTLSTFIAPGGKIIHAYATR